MRNIGLQNSIYSVRMGVFLWCLICISTADRRSPADIPAVGPCVRVWGAWPFIALLWCSKMTFPVGLYLLFPNPVLLFALQVRDIKSEQKLLLPKRAGQKIMITLFVVGLHFTQILIQSGWVPELPLLMCCGNVWKKRQSERTRLICPENREGS